MDAVIPVYNVGDVVRVVDEPNDETCVGWASEMDDFCGREVVITRRRDSYRAPGGFTYRIDADEGVYSWAADCFDAVLIEDIDPDVASPGIGELISRFGGA